MCRATVRLQKLSVSNKNRQLLIYAKPLRLDDVEGVGPGGAICMITKTGLGTADTDSKHTNKSMEKMMIPEADGDEEVILIFTVG